MAAHSCVCMCVCVWVCDLLSSDVFVHDENKVLKTLKLLGNWRGENESKESDNHDCHRFAAFCLFFFSVMCQ